MRNAAAVVVACVLRARGADASERWHTAVAQTSERDVTAVPGIKVGHFTLTERPTGCTVILVDGDAVGGVSQRGGAPGTRETDLLNPLNMVDKVNAVVLAGGSAFGLDAATGTVRWLEEHNIGWPAGASKVPIVPAAILFDLGVGGNRRCVRPPTAATRPLKPRPTAPRRKARLARAPARRSASLAARADRREVQASAAYRLSTARRPHRHDDCRDERQRSGDIIDPATGKVVAGVRNPDGTFADARKILRAGTIGQPRAGENTTIGVVATNAKLSKALAARMALMADDGYARAISPSHTNGDGDTIFSLATGRWDGTADITVIGALAAEVVADAIVRAAMRTTGVAGIPAARDLRK